MLTTIKLYGALAEKYGAEKRYAIKSAAEALKAINANRPGFLEDVNQIELSLIWTNTDDFDTDERLELDADMLHMRHPARVLHIVPAAYGHSSKGRGLTKILIGALIVTATIVTGGAAAAGGGLLSNVAGAAAGAAGAGAATASFLGLSSGMWALMGLNIALGGLSLMLAPSPGGVDPNDKEDNSASYLFNSLANLSQQGQPVPIVYGGPIRVGSVTVSAGADADQVTLPAGVSFDAETDTFTFAPADYWLWFNGYGGANFSIR